MGMGKTIQICALMAHLKMQGILKTSLLILPPILMAEWEKEMQKIIPSVTFTILSRAIFESEIDNIKSYDVAITYQSLLKSQRVLGKIAFKLIVCDEAQFIKNPATARAQAVIAMNGEFKISSTATPIENSISELWAILDYSISGYLPPLREFNKRYGERRVSDEEFNLNVDELKKRLLPVVLRRTKDEFLKDELPEKIINKHFCEIDAKQVLLCREISDAFKHEKSVTNFLHFFQLIVMALTNPEILDGQFGVVFPSDYVSPKISKTLSLLENIKDNNEKALIFADRKQVQGKLREVIQRHFGIKPSIINGQTSTALRKKIIQPFEPAALHDNKFDVLILSPRCAGFGLNLVHANHVIHYLRSFNPAIENQATDRVYRIGQERSVHVHILVSSTIDPDLKYTVEQKLDEMIERKQELLKDYLYASRAGRITEEDLANELNINNPGLSLADIDKLAPLEFEKFTSVLYGKQGYQTSLTPRQDYGADCIAVGHPEKPNALIQSKKKMTSSKSRIGNKAVQEIVAARKRYEEQMNVEFKQLTVVTNGYFTDQAKIQANDNTVSLIDRKKLSSLLDNYVITQTDFENIAE
jgi:SNF2 family DNA or RNA helicase